MEELLGLSMEMPWRDVLVRFAAAAIFGAVIGWERETREKPAGLRTHALVALAACLVTLLGYELIALESDVPERLRVDPIRIVEAVTSGVAFLAAGTIFATGERVQGLTTGAGIWMAGVIGIACGVGAIVLAALASVTAIIVLFALRKATVAAGTKTPR